MYIKENEKKVLMAVRILLESADTIEIFNKKAIYLYLREITGRQRRCGWLDLVALRYSCQINGVTKLMMMKSDVLSGFKSIKVCTSYEYKGKKIMKKM